MHYRFRKQSVCEAIDILLSKFSNVFVRYKSTVFSGFTVKKVSYYNFNIFKSIILQF